MKGAAAWNFRRGSAHDAPQGVATSRGDMSPPVCSFCCAAVTR